MMANIAASFPPHAGGMQQHPGAPPGHPMQPGMGHNPNQPGPGMPQHMVAHMGVSGPGPQINPAALMGGMPPGAGGPNAHAMQHLNPAQAQMFQQQHTMFANSPAVQAQMQQQQRLQVLQQQQQVRQALMTQQTGNQVGYGNINMHAMGMPLSSMNPQQAAQQAAQLAALRSRMPVSSLLPQFQQAQFAQHQQGQPMNNLVAQQIALQQHHQQMNQQMGQQGPNPNQHMGPGHMNIQQAHQLAALQAQQQAAQAAQAAQQQQAQQQAQAQQQQQQQGQGQPQGQAQPQQPGPQSQGQGGPNTNGPATSQAPTQGQTPQPNSQQQPQAPPQTPQTTQAQQAQLAAQAQQVAQNAAGAAATNLIQQQQAQQQAQQQHQQKVANVNTRGLCMLKLIQFAEQLSGFPGSKSKDDLAYWNNFVHQFFSPRGLFRLTILVKEGGENRQDLDKQYELAVPALPRYFHTHFESGIKSIQLNLDKCTIDKPLPHDCYYMEYHKASLVYWFETGSHLVTRGILRAQFDHEQKIDLFEFTTTAHEEYIARDFVIQSARPVHNWIKEWRSLNQQDGTHSPEMSNKKNKQKPYKCPANPPPDLDLPMPPTKTSTGITDAVYQFLEIVEIIGQMSPLFHYYHQHPGLGPYAALEQYVGQINNAGQVVNGQNMAQGGPRTPSFNQFGMGQSPAMGNSILPGSPHVAGSPAPGQMQAPGMQLQASQQGTSSSGPSANTSPSQNNKRRRPSTVKTEDDTPASAPTPGAVGTPQVNGVAKKPPTPRMGKRQKVNPSG